MKDNKKGIKTYLLFLCMGLIFIGLGTGLTLTKSNEKENKESNNNENNTENNNVEPIEPDIPVEIDYNITKEEAEEFLNELAPDSIHQNLLIAGDDEMIFYRCLQYFTLSEKYVSKNDNVYVFNQSDFKDLARKYYMNDDFDYVKGREGIIVKYDESNKTITATINIGLFGTAPEFKKTKSITEFNFENNIADLVYNINNTYIEPIEDSNGNTIVENNINYHIKLAKVNNEIRIKEISNQ